VILYNRYKIVLLRPFLSFGGKNHITHTAALSHIAQLSNVKGGVELNKNLLIVGAGIYSVVAFEIATEMGCFDKIDFIDDTKKATPQRH